MVIDEDGVPVVPNFRALLLVRVLTAGGSGAGGRRGFRPAVVERRRPACSPAQSRYARYASILH